MPVPAAHSSNDFLSTLCDSTVAAMGLRARATRARATKGVGVVDRDERSTASIGEEYGTVEELLQRRASGAELEGALESLRDKGLSNTVLSNEEILLEIEEMSLDSKMSVSPNSRS